MMSTEQRLRRALESELAELWADLDHAQQDAINGAWSIGCERLANRIEIVTHALGAPIDWKQVQHRILMNGLYELLNERIGHPVKVPLEEMIDSWRRLREDNGQSADMVVVDKAMDRTWTAHFLYTPVGDDLGDLDKES
jgi:hypothetical protein